MRINIRGGREIAVSQPLLNHLHRDTVCQKQTGARVAQIVKADAPQMIIPQDTFIDIFQKYSFPTYFFNSLLAAGVSTLVSLLFYAMGAHVIAKFEFPGRKLLFALFTITLLVPSHSKTQPIFSLITKLNLYDSIWGVTLVYLSPVWLCPSLC